MLKRITEFLRTEAVFTASWVLALLSVCICRPDKEYMTYIDFRTLGLLFCLMAVMAGVQSLGFFKYIGFGLLKFVKNSRQLEMILVGLCFFSGMLITNDVALLTFVPFAIQVLDMADQRKRMIPVVILQTIAANMGSAMTPIGNPQNLYLYTKSGISPGKFFTIMFPYGMITLILLLFFLFLRKNEEIPELGREEAEKQENKKIYVYILLFVLCLFAVARLLSVGIAAAVILLWILLWDRSILEKIDYILLLTFVGFFIFIGNLGRIPAVSNLLGYMVQGHEILAGIFSSQIISNVPAAFLLSGFSKHWEGLIVGTNLGGLGTLIASMASLISYKIIMKELPKNSGQYLLLFTAANVVFLAVLLISVIFTGGIG